MTSDLLELFGIPTYDEQIDWGSVVADKYCPFLNRTCVKTTKTRPPIILGTCSGIKGQHGLIICPHRFLERRQVFMDCIHLLSQHEPGNELHIVSELAIPGGSVDYVLASVKGGKVIDFVGIELQALDTTGSLWMKRQQFLESVGVTEAKSIGGGTWGINWMMTAKTTLIQLMRKIETFEYLNRHLVLVLQTALLLDMQSKFALGHIEAAKLGDSMHFHGYELQQTENNQLKLVLQTRLSTDARGVATALGMQISPNVELEAILAKIQVKLSNSTLMTI